MVMKRNLEQRLRGAQKLSINRQYYDFPVEDNGTIPMADFHRVTDFIADGGHQVSPADPYDIAHCPHGITGGDSMNIDLPCSGVQMHIHDGVTGNYGQNGQSTAHFKEYGSERHFGGLTSYEAAMGDVWAERMGLSRHEFSTKKYEVTDEGRKMFNDYLNLSIRLAIERTFGIKGWKNE